MAVCEAKFCFFQKQNPLEPRQLVFTQCTCGKDRVGPPGPHFHFHRLRQVSICLVPVRVVSTGPGCATMRPIDAVHQDQLDKRRFEREFESATLHDLTYSLDDWKASSKHAFPRERLRYQDAVDAPDAPSPQLPPVRLSPAVSRPVSRAEVSRPVSRAEASPSVHVPQLPLRGAANRTSNLLAGISPHQWAELTKDGAPEAWQVTRKGTKQFNTNMRKELAHISRLRNMHRQGHGRSTTPNAGLFESRQGAPGGAGPANLLQMDALPSSSNVSRQRTPANVRPATSMSVTAPPAGSSGVRELTPNTLRQQHIVQLLGTQSRPSTVFQVLQRRQPQAQFHMMWMSSAGPKRFDSYEKNMEAELLAEKKASNVRRRALIKQLRHKMQLACSNTKTLPTDLWQKFKVADNDGSGRVEVERESARVREQELASEGEQASERAREREA